MLWTALVAGCGLLGRTAYYGWVLAAAKDAIAGNRLLPEIASEALLRNAAELSLGTLAAVVAAHSTLALVYAVPLVISLQRSAHVALEARVDGKTGLLNDKTWRREAAGEIARAARTRTPLALGWAFLSQAFVQRCGVVPGVTEVGVGTVGEQSPDACWPAVSRCGVQGQPLPFGIGFVDRGSGFDELIDHVQPLVVGREDQRADTALDGEPAQRPGADVSRGSGHLQAVDAGSGGHQDIDDLGHPEHRGVAQRGAAGCSAGVGCGDGLDVGPGLDQYPGDVGVTGAGRGDQRCLLVPGMPVDRGARVDEGPGDGAGAGSSRGRPSRSWLKCIIVM